MLRVNLPGDDAVANVAAGPQVKPLPGIEVGARLVVSNRDRYPGTVTGVQRLLVVPARLRREVPDEASVAQGAGPDHQGAGVIRVLPRGRTKRGGEPLGVIKRKYCNVQ